MLELVLGLAFLIVKAFVLIITPILIALTTLLAWFLLWAVRRIARAFSRSPSAFHATSPTTTPTRIIKPETTSMNPYANNIYFNPDGTTRNNLTEREEDLAYHARLFIRAEAAREAREAAEREARMRGHRGALLH